MNLAVASFSILACKRYRAVSWRFFIEEIRGAHPLHSESFSCLVGRSCFLLQSFLRALPFWPLLHLLKTFWFDQISVSQGNLLLKSQTIQQIPSFIARSSRMLVLWDDSFFARSWCNFELAVQGKVAPYERLVWDPFMACDSSTGLPWGSGIWWKAIIVDESHAIKGSDTIEIVPTWTPVWTLVLIGVQAFVCSIASRTPAQLKSEIDVPVDVYANVAFAVPFSWFCFQKLKRHKSMLDQMASFDIRNAKCALETDRIVTEEQVFRLFDEAAEPAVSVALDDLGANPEPVFLETALPLISPDFHEVRHITSYPTKNEVMDQFNTYVRGTLRDPVLSSTGLPRYVFDNHLSRCPPQL